MLINMSADILLRFKKKKIISYNGIQMTHLDDSPKYCMDKRFGESR